MASVAGPFEWTVFWIAVVAMLALDVAVAHRGARSRGVRSAALWSGVWIGLGLAFGAWLFWRFGAQTGAAYLAAYALEKSLSVDNLFVFALVFAHTGIPPALQHRALFWGIASALAMRAVMIGLGVYLLARFHWVIYPFALVLAYGAWRMLRGEEAERKLSEATCALCTSWVGKLMPITPRLEGSRFLVRREGRLVATPLLVALVAIEATDLVFAVDSIPAVLAITRDPFLVYTSNVFALLGLRSLYFLLAGAIGRLRFLRTGLAVMLAFVAAKMLLTDVVEIAPGTSLAVIALIFAVAIAASRLFPAGPAGAGDKPRACTHLDQVREVRARTSGCEECMKLGSRWVSLRVCLTCGHVGCCDSSRHKHATAHFAATGHPVMRSAEPGESWRWCYVDRVMLD